jgi:hypothetical protein
MTEVTVVWLVLAAAFAALFFGIAAVVSIRGVKDLRELLGGADRVKKRTDLPEQNKE